MGWVEDQRGLQIETYGLDPEALTGAARAQFIRDTVLAATEELHEILRMIDWKPWHEGERRYGEDGPYDQQDFEDEFGDVMCFLGNLALVCGLGTDDVIAGFERKVGINRDRHDYRTRSER